MDLAELNPTYDRDQATAKLAAGLAYELIDYYP
jgi:arginase family enzyme